MNLELQHTISKMGDRVINAMNNETCEEASSNYSYVNRQCVDSRVWLTDNMRQV